MIHQLFNVALVFLACFISWKLGAANEQIRVQRVLRSALQGREVQTESGRAHGASRPSSIGREPLAEPSPADNGVPSRDHPPSRPVLFDGEAAHAPHPPYNAIAVMLRESPPDPPLSLVEALEDERPELRVVDPS